MKMETKSVNLEAVKRELYSKQLKKEKGITLLALAVTIIIMLILAGVTISVALSDGGLIDTTKQAVREQRIAEMKTKIELIVTNWTAQKMLNDNVTVDDLKQALVDGGVTDSKDKVTGSDGRYEVETIDGDIFEIIIDESGNIKVNIKGEGSGGEGPGGDDKPGGDQTASLEINVTEATTNSINVSVTTDSLQGNTLTYSYKEISGAEYTVVKQNSNETSHNFIGLGSNTSYKIKVELKNTEGKVIAQKEIETKTEEQKIGTISQKGELTWNNGKASIELQSTEPTDVIQYQIGGNSGTWQDYTGPIGNLNSGDTVYAKVKGSSVETSIPIVDGIAPTVTVQRGTVNTSSITAVVTASDDESGMSASPTYKYYIKKTSETAYPQNPSYTGSNMSNAFTGLKQGTSYDIKVTVEDVAGNEGTGFLNNISTENVGGASGGLETGNITLGTVTWNNGLATVTLNTTTSFSIQYQKNSNTEGNWTTAGTTATITDLHHGDTVFARLWDGTNAGSDASVSIIDDKEPQLATISFSPTTANTGETITATVTLADNESGIDLTNSRWIYTNSSTPLGTENPSLYTGGTFESSTSLSLKATTAGNWYLHVLSVDNGGNKKETVSSGVEITQAEIASLDRNRGDIEIAFVNMSNQPISGEEVPTPTLGEGMIPVKWNEVDSSWYVCQSTDSSWYSYTQTDKKWANVMLTDGLVVEGITDAETASIAEMAGKKVTTVGSMFVYIPRYSYKIVYKDTSGNVIGYSDSDGITDINGNIVTGTKKQGAIAVSGTVDGKTIEKYVLHPAFTTNTANGGWSSELDGIWVAKFEASHANATSSSAGSSTTMKIQPGVQSWRSISVNAIFTKCRDSFSGLNSHMMKNSEWGACAYLATSVYGTNGKIWINPNSNYVTGQAGDSVSASATTSTSAYTTTNGQKASTTGNVYGIYDMSGGSWEYVASYVNNGNSNLTNSKYGASCYNGAAHLKQVYSKGSSDSNEPNYQANKGKYGDAVYETSSAGNNYTSWYDESSLFPYSDYPFFVRGRYYNDFSLAGAFAFGSKQGEAVSYYSFRPVLATP